MYSILRKIKSNHNIMMNKSDLKKLSKSQLIKLLMNQGEHNQHKIIKPIPKPRTKVIEKATAPRPRTKVLEKPTLKPRFSKIATYKKEIEEDTIRLDKEIHHFDQLKKTWMNKNLVFHETKNAFKGYDKTYSIEVPKDVKDPFMYLEDTKKSMRKIINKALSHIIRISSCLVLFRLSLLKH